MSAEIEFADEGYRAVGKHRFAAKVFGLVLALTLIGVTLSFLVGDARSMIWMRLLTAGLWIVQSVRSILMSDERLVELAESDPIASVDASPRTLRGWSILSLIGFTVLATLDIHSLIVPE